MDVSKSLEELENSKWGKPKFDSSLAKSCYALRAIPISELTPENLRMLIGQNIGLDYLVPLALNILEDNPLVSGDMYAGDLLASILRIPKEFWSTFPDLNNRVVELKNEIEILRDTINEELMPAMVKFDYR